MPRPEPEGGAPPQYMALQSLPIDIPWVPGATAVYDLVRCVDLPGAVYGDLTAPYAAEEARVLALLQALPADAGTDARKALEAEFEANDYASSLAILAHVRCQVAGINPTPVPDKPETWRHLHPALCRWLAHQGRQAAAAQLQSPLAQLRPPR